jgi:hypothetical protein
MPIGVGIIGGAVLGGLSGLLKKDPNAAARVAMTNAYKSEQALFADQYNRTMENVYRSKQRDFSTVWNKYQMTTGAEEAASAVGRGKFGTANNKNFATYANTTDDMAGKYLDTINGLKDKYSDQQRQSQIDYDRQMAGLPEDQPWYSKMFDGMVGGASAGIAVDKGLTDLSYGDKIIEEMTNKTFTEGAYDKYGNLVDQKKKYVFDPAKQFSYRPSWLK